MDESGSVGLENFNLVKAFLLQLVNNMGNDPLVGLITFYGKVDTNEAFNLNTHSSLADVSNAIMALTYSGSATRTDLALAYVRNTMLTQEAGDRPTHPNVVIVLTDGESNEGELTKVCIA